jgi:hypothetical protein
MGVFDRPKLQKQAINTLILTLSTSFGLLTFLLILKSTQLANVKTEIFSNVALGPVNLIQIHKLPLNGGYQATIKVLPGLLAYFGIWTLIAVLALYLRFIKNKDSTSGGF